jgi:tetratricopeptide (TPR) repeat protein
MTFEIPIRSGATRLLLGLVALSAFAVLASRAEAAFFADRLAKIPLFGTELAAKAEPEDPEYEYELGNYWIIAAQQAKTALPHLQRATQLDAFNGHYWGQLALAYQQIGDASHADDALNRSLAADPTTPDLLWQAANVYSFLGERERATDSIHRFVISTPEQSPIAAQLGWRATRDADLLLNQVLPKGPHSDLSLLIALVRAEDPSASARIQPLDVDPNDVFVHNLVRLAVPEPSTEQQTQGPLIDLAAEKEKARANMLRLIDLKTGHDWSKTEEELAAEHLQRTQAEYRAKQSAKQQAVEDDADVFAAASLVWKRLMSEPDSFDVRLALPYIQMLIDSDLDAPSRDAWAILAAREKRLNNWSVPNNLIKNGSFEYELLNGALDWQYTVSDVNTLAIDHRTSREGDSSLLLRFEDKPVADAGIVQYVPVKPDTQYEFTGFLKGDSLDGATGLRFQVQDTDSDAPYFMSPDAKGTFGWTKLSGRFVTSSSAHFVAVRIVRDPANTLIKGNAWADSVSLTEVGAK